MTEAFHFSKEDILEFVDLVSDDTVRCAAWPMDSWLAAGGLTSEYRVVALSDSPPFIHRLKPVLGIADLPNAREEVGVTQAPDERAACIAGHLEKVRMHQLFIWLNEQPHFRKANTLFEKKCARSQGGPYRSEFARFRFLRMVALIVGALLHRKKLGLKRKSPTARQRDQAIGHIEDLQRLLQEGIGVRDSGLNVQLSNLLAMLAAELTKSPRKEKETKTMETRKYLELLAAEMLRTFEEASPTILVEIAELCGWEASNKTIDRIARSARDKWKTKGQLPRS